MTRAVFEALLFFVIPFIAFALWLILRRKPVMSKESWQGAGGWLMIAGLAIVIVGLIWNALRTEHHTGAYVPSRLENGRLVPGQVR